MQGYDIATITSTNMTMKSKRLPIGRVRSGRLSGRPMRARMRCTLMVLLSCLTLDAAHGVQASIAVASFSSKRLPGEAYTPFEPTCAPLLMRLLTCEEGGAVWHSKVKGAEKTTAALCWAGEGSSSQSEGLLVVREPWDVSQLFHKQSVFRVRAVGPQIVQIPMLHCGHSLYLAHIKLSRLGAYNFEILRLFKSFSFSDLQSAQNVTEIASFKWISKPAQEPAASSDLSNNPCSEYPLQGTWLSRTPQHPRITALYNTYTDLVFPPPNLLAATYADDVLEWRPLHCRLLRWEEMATRSCLTGRHVCFVGDSHMRELHNGFVTTLPHILAGQTQPGSGPDVPPTKVSKTVKSSNLASYIWDVWGNITTAATLQHCTDVLMNFGQWPLSYQSGKAPWSIQAYRKAVVSRAELLRQLHQQGKGVMWMTTHAYPWRDTNTGPAPTDWRMAPWVQLYNSVALRVMMEYQVGLFDVSAVTSTLVDLTIDGSHYHSNGTVGHAMNQYLSNYLCSLAAGGGPR